jgi:hypothetical protein
MRKKDKCILRAVYHKIDVFLNMLILKPHDEKIIIIEPV